MKGLKTYIEEQVGLNTPEEHQYKTVGVILNAVSRVNLKDLPDIQAVEGKGIGKYLYMTYDQLMSLRGIGPERAVLIMSAVQMYKYNRVLSDAPISPKEDYMVLKEKLRHGYVIARRDANVELTELYAGFNHHIPREQAQVMFSIFLGTGLVYKIDDLNAANSYWLQEVLPMDSAKVFSHLGNAKAYAARFRELQPQFEWYIFKSRDIEGANVPMVTIGNNCPPSHKKHAQLDISLEELDEFLEAEA